ncbi:MAG: OmpA family protein [Firmicutes bacterium]|nr:OmpA family protein [Bacillota bacterium]
MRRRSQENSGGEKGPSMERWLLTYADMITLLMIFFILMYVMSSINMQKFRALAAALNVALKGEPTGIFREGGPSFMPGEGEEASQMANVQRELEAYLEKQNLANLVTIREEERGLVVSFQETVLFPRGSATLTPEARRIIAQVGAILKDLPNYIRVEGHTDNLPINTPQFPSNWELSSARATNVVRELIAASQIPPARLSATGYGEYRPRYPNDSEAHRQLNRRVDILILRTMYGEVEPSSRKKPTP